ncbi:MAG: ribosomal protein L13e [Nitrospinae bacterium]|nr:ribosomal protein L13e [Nitrospinota bacterium]
MNIKKNFLSRIARRKSTARAESEEGDEIPPPPAIEPYVPYATGNSEDKELGSHQELELIASGEPASSGSANSVDAVDGGDAPALDALAGPVKDGLPDAPEPPREAVPYEEYGLDLELLSETESKASREETESSHDDEVAASGTADSVAEASAPEPEVIQESEPEAADDAVAGDEETRTASVLQDSPHEDGLPLVDEEADSEMAESAAEAAAPEPEISRESEPAEDITEEVGEPLSAVMQELPGESPEPALAENGIFPLVRDARGVWRPGKGFSRGELREAGLSLADASRLHIRFDKRRRNTHTVNVASLEQAKSGV